MTIIELYHADTFTRLVDRLVSCHGKKHFIANMLAVRINAGEMLISVMMHRGETDAIRACEDFVSAMEREVKELEERFKDSKGSCSSMPCVCKLEGKSQTGCPHFQG